MKKDHVIGCFSRDLLTRKQVHSAFKGHII